jgi:hypothetical protein
VLSRLLYAGTVNFQSLYSSDGAATPLKNLSDENARTSSYLVSSGYFTHFLVLLK